MRTAIEIALGVALALAAGAAAGQQYSCKTKAGTPYLSEQPCSAIPGSTRDHSAPAVRSGNLQAPYVPPPSSYGSYSGGGYGGYGGYGRPTEAPPWLKHMSARCASLHDALRTAGTRGLKPETVATMQRDYRAECGENERIAQMRASEEAREGYMQKRESAIATAQAEQLTREQASLRAEQCAESRRILNTKKARPHLSDGEKAELARFEENFRSRCASAG